MIPIPKSIAGKYFKLLSPFPMFINPAFQIYAQQQNVAPYSIATY